jgi:hypothetical protein
MVDAIEWGEMTSKLLNGHLFKNSVICLKSKLCMVGTGFEIFPSQQTMEYFVRTCISGFMC